MAVVTSCFWPPSGKEALWTCHVLSYQPTASYFLGNVCVWAGRTYFSAGNFCFWNLLCSKLAETKKANICTWFIEVKRYHTPRGTKLRIVALTQWSCNKKLTLRITLEYVGMNWNIFLKLCMLDFLTQWNEMGTFLQSISVPTNYFPPAKSLRFCLTWLLLALGKVSITCVALRRSSPFTSSVLDPPVAGQNADSGVSSSHLSRTSKAASEPP